jgi:hypothetical protein
VIPNADITPATTTSAIPNTMLSSSSFSALGELDASDI